jgi:hypothetical protein
LAWIAAGCPDRKTWDAMQAAYPASNSVAAQGAKR